MFWYLAQSSSGDFVAAFHVFHLRYCQVAMVTFNLHLETGAILPALVESRLARTPQVGAKLNGCDSRRSQASSTEVTWQELHT